MAIPYKGSAELTAALLAGQVDFACSNLGALLGHLRSGALRALMTTKREPLKELPGVPTARSSAGPRWRAGGVVGARRTARAAARGDRALEPGDGSTSSDPGWLAGNEKLGGVSAVRSPAETEAFVRAQFALYFKLAMRLGLGKRWADSGE